MGFPKKNIMQSYSQITTVSCHLIGELITSLLATV